MGLNAALAGKRYDTQTYEVTADAIHAYAAATNETNPAFTGQLTNLVMMNPGHANTNKVRQTGPVDPAVTVLSLQTLEGKPLALLANYSTHYANAPVQEISADYFGEFCELIARDLKANELNPGFVALMSNGTSGDANCSDFTKTNWLVNPVIVAEAVAATMSGAVADLAAQIAANLGSSAVAFAR